MLIIYIIISGIVATIVMTVFSYIVANLRRKQFREPELLNHLLNYSTIIPGNYSKNHIAGWLLHFLIGIAFAFSFYLVNLIFNELSIFLFSILFGIAAGIIAIISWHLMIHFSNNPPDISLKEFYIQLIIAHILFSITTGYTLNVLQV